MLNQAAIKKAIYSRFSSIGEFCQAIGVHRNSLSLYLSGKKLLPEVIEKTLSYLQIDSKDVFQTVIEKPDNIEKKVSSIVGGIVSKHPDVSVVIFGSRARGTERKYSDVDLGIIGKEILSLEQWSDIRDIVDKLSEDMPYMFDVVDLRRADKEFLENVKNEMKFLGGNPVNYYSILN